MSLTPLVSAPSNPTEDRRSSARRRFDRLTYAELGPGNGGILLDISESGLRFQSVGPVFPGDLLPVSFVLTGSVGAVKAAAEIIWCNDSGKGGGLRFVDLPEEARKQIGTWVSSDPAPATPFDGTARPESGREKFNLLTTEGHSTPEPASDAAALAMARLLVSARGSSKLHPKHREGASGQNGHPSQNSPAIDPDARPEALMAAEPAAAVDYAETVDQPVAAASSQPVVTQEAPVGVPFVYEPVAEQVAEPLAETAETHPSPALAPELSVEEVFAEDVLPEAPPLQSAPEPVAFAEIAPPPETEISAAEMPATSEPLPVTIADETVLQAHTALVSAMLQPPAEPATVEAVAIESHASESAEIPSTAAEQAAEPEPMLLAPSAIGDIATSEAAAIPQEAKASAPTLTYNKNEKTKPAQRNPLASPSNVETPVAARAKAATPPVPRSVPHWGVQVLRFAVGVGVGCCLVAGTFVGLQLLGPGHRTFSLTHARPAAVEAAAPSAGQPLDVEVIDLNSRRWHLSDDTPGNNADNAVNAALIAPQTPVVELTPGDPSSPRLAPAPANTATTPRVPVRPQQIRRSGSKLLAMQPPRAARKSGSAGDLRAPSIFDSATPAMPSSLGNVEPRGPAPVAPETARPVFPSAVGTVPAHYGEQAQAAVLIEQVSPIYPPSAKQQHVTGTVRVNAIIGKEGIPHSLRVISGDARLAPAAIAAVSQWLYRPAQLDGEPVESETTISVEFRLRQ